MPPELSIDQEAMIVDIARLVSCESPSSDHGAVARSAEEVAAVITQRTGATAERIVIDGVTHLRVRWGRGPRRTLVLAHHDTVWPIGSLRSLPFHVRDGVITGPGCFDMKTGLVMAIHAVAALSRQNPRLLDGVTMLVTGDEEVGSPTSRALIEQEALGCSAALVLEAAAEHGALKTVRKGVSTYHLRVHGRAAHAGLDPENGVNATLELAHQILFCATLAAPAAGTTVTPTTASAGETGNTVPAEAVLYLDVRASTEVEQERVDDALRAARPHLPDARITIEGGPNRAPLTAQSSSALFARAEALAERLGLPPLTRASVGGGSDGNLTAGLGVPTLDGLGAVGGGAHAEDEHVEVAHLVPRTRLLAALIEDLGGTT